MTRAYAAAEKGENKKKKQQQHNLHLVFITRIVQRAVFVIIFPANETNKEFVLRVSRLFLSVSNFHVMSDRTHAIAKKNRNPRPPTRTKSLPNISEVQAGGNPLMCK